MLVKKNDLLSKINHDNARAADLTMEDIQNALIELGGLFSEQDDAIVELASVLMEGNNG